MVKTGFSGFEAGQITEEGTDAAARCDLANKPASLTDHISGNDSGPDFIASGTVSSRFTHWSTRLSQQVPWHAYSDSTNRTRSTWREMPSFL